MKFKKEHGIIIGFVATLLVPLVAGIFVRNHYDDEKKTPASYPTYISDSYFQQVNAWYNDHSPFRSGMIDTYTAWNSSIEEPFRNWLVEIDIQNKKNNHEHHFSEWEIIKDATEEESGLKTRICDICGLKEEEIIPMIPHVHTFSEAWSYDEYEHWHDATCKHTSLKSDVAAHEFGETLYDKDNSPYHVCSICGCISYIKPEGEHVHIFSSAWSSDDTYHWHNSICEHKDLRINEEEHVFSSWHVHDEANGLKAQTCEVCDYEHIENILDKLETKIIEENPDYYPYVAASKDVLIGRDEWLYYLGDSSVEYYKASNIMSDEYRTEQINKMQRLQDACDKKGIKLIFIELPNKDQVYPEYMPTVEGRQNVLKRAQRFNNYLQLNTGFEFTYPLTVLTNGKQNYPTYYQQDSHWNEYGGALASQEVYRRLGWDFKGFEVNMVKKSGGDLIALANNSVAPATYLEPKITYNSDITLSQTFTSTYLDQIESSNENDKKMLLMGDSFRFSIVPYFTREVKYTMSTHRNRMTTKDVNYRNMVANFVYSLKAGDIIVYEFAERLDTDAFKKLDNLIALVETNP